MDVAAEVHTIVQTYLQGVKRAGSSEIIAFCPFHDNRNTPAFSMNLVSGLYYCHSCHESGNLLMFLQRVGVTWNVIEKRYRDVLDSVTAKPRKSTGRCGGIVVREADNSPLPEHLLGLFNQLTPDKWAAEEGLSQELLARLEVGVDLEHQRITFPLRTIEGVLVGISGRDYTNTALPKYKVYDKEYQKWGLPEHRTYKSQLLWNGHAVYPRLYYERLPLVIVEGFKACMKVLQAGVFNVVALLGNRISLAQSSEIQQMANEVWLFLDNNQAGLVGTVLSGSGLGLPTRIIPYPDEREQPSDLSEEEILLALQQPKDFTRWLLETPAAMQILRDRQRRKVTD